MAKTYEIYFDPKNNETVVKDDEDLVCFEEDKRDISPWVLRVTIDPVLLGRKGIKLQEIINRIKIFIPDDQHLQIIESLETADPIVLRLRFLHQSHNPYADI
ncbi:MAG: hypothetical protein GY786_01480 [Proteobacteria bacterium]|nr:hypothetical protein [Pseudomonadota bacterium]